MTRANVQSTEAIQSVRTAMVSFVDQVRDALVSLDLEMRRVLEWLEHDRPRHWKVQMRQAIDGVNDAQAALHRCLMYPIADERPACTDERVALKRAKARFAYCQAKEERVRDWIRTVRHELFEYEGRISQLTRVAEIDAPEAIGILTKILRRLEEYQAIRTNSGSRTFDDHSLAAEIWPDGAPASTGETTDPYVPGATPDAAASNPSDQVGAPMPDNRFDEPRGTEDTEKARMTNSE